MPGAGRSWRRIGAAPVLAEIMDVRAWQATDPWTDMNIMDDFPFCFVVAAFFYLIFRRVALCFKIFMSSACFENSVLLGKFRKENICGSLEECHRNKLHLLLKRTFISGKL